MVRSAATPRVSNHEAPMLQHEKLSLGRHIPGEIAQAVSPLTLHPDSSRSAVEQKFPARNEELTVKSHSWCEAFRVHSRNEKDS
jgi:hypothetical protein